MKVQNSYHFEEKKTNTDIFPPKIEKKYIYHYNFDIKYEILNSTIKDIQMVSQLIKLIKDNQIDDIIFISGNSTSSVDSRFYLNYRKIFEFYTHVLEVEENENFLKIVYHVYKTKPICKNFILIFSLFKIDKNARIEIEIILPKTKIISDKILSVLYNEFDYNFLYLSLALKLKKEKFINYNSSIINNEFFVLSQIIQNTKLIEYLINRKLVNLNDSNNYKKDKNIHLNDIYTINPNKDKKDISMDNISFKIINFKSKEDKLIIKIKLLSKDKLNDKNDSNINSLFNIATIKITKITKSSTFILIKWISDPDFDKNNTISIKKILDKILSKLVKLSNITKNNISQVSETVQ